jgi:transposase
MTQYKRIAIDTSKAVFTLHGIDHAERPTLRLNLRRGQMIDFFTRLPPTEIALEACGGGHHWARELTALGHEVHLIPPQYVTPYVKRGKNDRNDAAAICEAGGRPGMHVVPVKSIDQQAQGMVLKVRGTLVDQRTQLCNTVRGHAAEFGVVGGKGRGQVAVLLSVVEQQPAIPPEAKAMFVVLGQQIDALDPADPTHRWSAGRRAQIQPGQPTPGHHPRRRSDHRIDAGDRDRSRRVRIGPPPGRMGRSDAEGTFDRRQTADGRDQPGGQ